MASGRTSDWDFERDGYNKLFLEWLTEWKHETAGQQSNAQYAFARAFSSLKAYPVPVFGGHGCINLKFFGPNTCKKLEIKLARYLKENKLPRVTGPSDPFLPAEGDSAAAVRRSPKKKKSPTKRSAGTLAAAASQATDDADVPVTAPEKAPRKRPAARKKAKSAGNITENLAEESDTVPPLPTIAIPAKNKAKTLISKSCSVQIISGPSTCCESASGGGLSTCLPSTSRSVSSTCVQEVTTARPTGLVYTRGVTTTLIGGGGGFTARTLSATELATNAPRGSQSQATRFDQIPLDAFTLRPGSFDVVLCVDNQEIHGKGNTRSKLDIVAELKKQKLNFSVRSLKAGDFLWIAQEKTEAAAREKRQPRELVLDFIAERKRGDDLAISIKDGRYTCQKFRMKTASLRRIIYIVEDAQRFQNKGLSDQAFHQALANIEIQDGFLVKQTENLKKTADYLFMMTKYLQRSYATKTLKSCTYAQRCEDSSGEFSLSVPTQNLLSFDTFSAVAKTNQAKSVSQAFLLHLLALDGVSPAKASAIIAKYPTIRKLVQAYDECSSQREKELLLRDIPFGSGITKIGPAISKKLCHLYCTTGPLL